jgi:hypothetical protein
MPCSSNFFGKFRDLVTGKPVSLGADGSLATGVKPLFYLSEPAAHTPGSSAVDFLTNHARGGVLSLNAESVSFVVAPTAP